MNVAVVVPELPSVTVASLIVATGQVSGTEQSAGSCAAAGPAHTNAATRATNAPASGRAAFLPDFTRRA